MPSAGVRVSVSEVLEVRAGPLTDWEIWALLNRASHTLTQAFHAGSAVTELGPVFVINPDTVNLTSGGSIEFGTTHREQQYANYMAPEMEEPEFTISESTVEGVYMFALGKSMIYSSEYALSADEPVRISEHLEGVLRGMTHRDPSRRTMLRKLSEACEAQNERERRGLRRSFSRTVTNLYQTILGPIDSQEEGMQISIPQVQLASKSGHLNISPRDSATKQKVSHGSSSSHSSRERVSPREYDLSTDRSGRRDDLSGDRSRRKDKKSHDRSHDRIRRRPQSSPEQYRSRSRSRSRSRTPVKHRNPGKDSDSSDLEVHRITPLHHSKRSTNESPSLGHMTSGQANGGSYHLSDITFSAAQNGHQSHHQSSTSHNSKHGRPSNRNPPSQRSFENAAFKKYLKLKERQKKLRVLRHDVMSDEASDELSDFVADHISETRSVRSMGSANLGVLGVYQPDIHMRYGSSSALKFGRDSDRESVISSDASVYGYDHVPFRATADISDPYIEQLQRLTQNAPAVNQPVNQAVSQSAPPTNAPPTSNKQKQKQKPPSPKLQKPRDFYGPEFVHRSSKPLQRIPIPLQGDGGKNAGHTCRVVVVLLNGQKLEAMVNPSTMGQQLFEAVVTEIELPEFYFFGLTYINDNEHFFLSGDTKLHKVAPEGWRDSWKREAAPVTFTLHLRVKFYVDSLSALKQETSRHQLYLQLRRDILEERCLCDEDRVLALAGLAMQAEYGDYSKEAMGRNYFIPEHYFPERVVKRLGTTYMRDHAPEYHKQHTGLSEVEAQMEFIRFMQEEVQEYGIHFHKLLKKKSETQNVIWVGVNMNQLVLAENSGGHGGERILVHGYPWGAIQKISFNRRRFSVQPRPDLGQIKPVKLNFYTTSYRKGEYLLKFCTSQHSFLLKIRTRLAAHDGLTDLSQSEQMSIGDTEDMGSVHSEDDHQTITEDTHSRSSQDFEPLQGGFAATDHVPQKHPAAYRQNKYSLHGPDSLPRLWKQRNN